MNVSNLVSLIFCRYVKYCDCEFSTAETEKNGGYVCEITWPCTFRL